MKPVQPESQTIGQKLRAARRAQGLTQAQLAKNLVTPSMISQIEADRTKPSSALLTSLANRLGFPMEYFLNDVDEQFTFQTYLRQAEYELLLERPEIASRVLAKMASLELRGNVRQQYNLLLARAYRLQGKYVEASDLLEECREYAHRTRDVFLQFQLNKESGYLEYAMNNDLGAIGEWQKALQIGEDLTNEVQGNGLLMFDLFDLGLKMSESLSALNRFPEAQQALERILASGKESGYLLGVAESFRADSQVRIEEGKSQEAKERIERAVTVIQSAKLSAEYLLAQTKLLHLKDHLKSHLEDSLEHSTSGQPDRANAANSRRTPTAERIAAREDELVGDDPDLWKQAALAVITTDPRPFLDSELILIERHLARNEVSAADRRISRCLDIVEDYCQVDVRFNRLTKPQRHKLWMIHAKVAYLQGKHELAISRAEQAASEMSQDFQDRDLHSSARIKVLAQLIEWYGEAGENEKVLELADLLQNLLEQGPDWSKLL